MSRPRYRSTSVRLPQADLDRFRAAAAVEDGGLVGPFLRRAAIRLSQVVDRRPASSMPSVTTTAGDPVITLRFPPANEESFKTAASITDGGALGAFFIRAGRVLAAEIERRK